MKFILDFKNQTTQAEIDSYLQSFSAAIVKTFNKFEKTFLVESTSTPPQSDIVEHIVNDETETVNLLSTVVNFPDQFGTIRTDGSVPTITITNNDEHWWKYYSLARPDLDSETYTFNRWGSNNTVYVLDSGCNTSLNEFAGTGIQNLWSFTGEFADTNGHGTAIASIIAGNTCGVTSAKVKNVKIFDNNVVTKQSDLVSALDAIFSDMITDPAVGYNIINASWSISKNAFIESKLNDLIAAGAIIVAAAGNNGGPIENVTPASMSDVITIGSYNQDLRPSDFSAYTGGSVISYTGNETNYGVLDGWAPGEKIWVAKPDGTFGFAAGTSMSAAIHSACLAVNLGYANIVVPRDPYNEGTMRTLMEMGLQRPDMLDLSDPKYANSTNKITTINDNFEGVLDGIPLLYEVTLNFGRIVAPRMVNIQNISSVEFLTDLPYGLVLSPIGKILGRIPDAPEGVRFQSFTIPVKATYRDGVVEEFDFKIHVIAQDWETGVDSSGDTELDIRLQYTFYCSLYGDCVYNEHTCIDECDAEGAWGWCNYSGIYCPKGAYACWCNYS